MNNIKMEKPEDTSFWLKFFKEAGIPSKTGASYAHIFIENRIHKNMLSDLTVDYLRLMGVTLMGDIIAILRHSKSVHQDSLRKVVILKSKEAPVKTNSSSSSSESSSSDDDVRMVEITKPVNRKMQSSSISSKVSQPKRGVSSLHSDAKQLKSKVTTKSMSTRPATTKRISSSESKPSVEAVKRKHEAAMDVDPEPAPLKSITTSNSALNANSGRSILKSPAVAAKKIRSTAENDIIGPKLPPPKKTVFDRLGSETSSPLVSSTTVELVKPEHVETRFTRIISSSSAIDAISSKMSSVFDRLGGLDSSLEEEKPKGPALSYAGVLKSSSSALKKSPANLLKKVGTMRADEPEVPVKLRAATKPLNKSLQIRVGESLLRKRLGSQQRLHKPTQARGRLASTPSEGIFANTTLSKTSKSVKQRLGSSSYSGTTVLRNNNPMRIKRPSFTGVQRRVGTSENSDERPYRLTSRIGVKDLKRVSFGNVEQKVFSSVSPMYSSREPKSKISIHRRLGAVRYK